MTRRFPKELVVTIDSNSQDKTSWFLAGETMAEMIGMNSKEKLAVYRLVEVREVVSGIVSHRKVRA